MLFSIAYRFVLILTALTMAAGCSTSSGPPVPDITGQWQQASLNGISVNNLSIFKERLYAATDSGLYMSSTVDGSAHSWTSLGLEKKKIIDMVFLLNNKFLAAIFVPGGTGESSFFLSADQGQTWKPHMGNYGGEDGKWTWVESLAAASKPSDTLFARSNGPTIARSTDGGKSWSLVKGSWDSWGGAAVLVQVDPYHTGRVWAGGVNHISLPYLFKSTDGGTTWEKLENAGTTAQVCYDVVTHPENEGLVLAGFAGAKEEALQIRKSVDGGQTWKTVLEDIGVLTLENSVRNAEGIYASGRNTEGTPFFVASTNFGDTWEMVQMEESPTDIQVNDMVSMMVGGEEVLYLGTNKGVYSYRFES